jgi:hypothetical protein
MKNRIILARDIEGAQAFRLQKIWNQLPVGLRSTERGTFPDIHASFHVTGRKRDARWLIFTPEGEGQYVMDVEKYLVQPTEQYMSDEIGIAVKRIEQGKQNPKRYVLTAHALTKGRAHMAHHAIIDVPCERFKDMRTRSQLLYIPIHYALGTEFL